METGTGTGYVPVLVEREVFMRKRLVYRADDIGYTRTFDLGAFQGMDEGIVTSADVMFDSPHTREALQWLKERPWISVGWHRHLWESPVADKTLVMHMVDEEGRFVWRHNHQELMNEVPYEEAYTEFKAEMALCHDVLGRYPDTCQVQPEAKNELEQAFKDVCAECGINMNVVRMGSQNPAFSHLNYHSWIVHADNSIMTSEEIMKKRGMVRKPLNKNEVYDLANFKNYDAVKNIQTIAWEEDSEIFMTGGHPGYLDEHIYQESTCTIHRLEELRCAISPEVKQWIIDNQIELVNQRDVIYGTNEYQDHLKEINSPLWVGNMKG